MKKKRNQMTNAPAMKVQLFLAFQQAMLYASSAAAETEVQSCCRLQNSIILSEQTDHSKTVAMTSAFQ